MAGVLSVGIIFRATKGQTGRGEPNPGPFVSSNGLQGLCEMALFFLVLFSTKPHLHDKQCYFEAACVISAYLSLIPDLLLLPLIFLFFFSSSFQSNSLFLLPPPFHAPSFSFIFDICLCAPNKSLDMRKMVRTFFYQFFQNVILFEVY